MAISADSIGLLFRIRADSKDAQADIKSLRKTFDDETKAIEKGAGGAFLRLGQSVGLSGEQMAKLKTGLTAAASAAAIAGTAAIAAGTAIFALTKRASDAGSEIYEFAQRTNLSTEFLSALKIQAEQSGSSLSSAAANVTKFSNSLVDAARGNKELTADLKRFGIDASDAYRNTEASVRAFIERFNQLPPSAANNEAAMRLFKDRTGEIIPVLRAFGTDIDGLMRRLGEMGLLWDKEGTEKADEFGDALTELGQAASGMSNVFAREVMPAITSAMKEMSKAAVENKAAFREWGTAVGDTIRGVRELADSNFGTVVGWLAKVAYYTTPLAMLVNQTRQIGAQAGDAEALKNFGPFGGRGVETPLTQGRPASSPLAPADVTNEDARKKAEAERKRLQSEAKRETERQVGIVERLRGQLRQLNVEYNLLYESEARQQTMQDALSSNARTLTDAHRKEADELLRKIEAKRKDLAQARASMELARALTASIDEAQAAARPAKTHVEEVNEALGRFVDAGGKADETLRKLTERAIRFARQRDLIEALEKTREAAERFETPTPVGDVGTIPQGTGPVVTENLGPPPELFTRWQEFAMTVRDSLQTIGASAITAGEMVGGVFSGMAQGMGQSIQAWVLYGGSIGKAIKAAVAATLAGLAAQSAVQAIYETALGFAALARMFFGDPRAAAEAKMHFTSAAIFAAVGGAAAVAGRAFAGGGAAGGAVAGSAFAAGGASGTGGGNGYEDYRARYLREQGEKDKFTSREDRRGGSTVVQLVVDGRELGRAVLNHVRDGGDLRDGFRSSLGVTA